MLPPKIDYQLIWKNNCLGDSSCIAISVNEKDPQTFPLEIPGMYILIKIAFILTVYITYCYIVDWWKKLLRK